ncbi:hypothetical protein EXU85_24370 [Spirosoma sp. KCTC 42546]|uniref:hypothetical protein n=1 Tax=Spirosoma sp. KCTC 42546 TaxID=2520506 RepID=UPI001157D06B|nr:hypothetical protein [Spirosoma sp. KCTC 42546]QDK81574.1 hypothetical protein EXU85_24370 [Spirosoma sp. KCTC 42546]
MLQHFRKRTSATSLLKACRHTHQHGTFAIALAVAIHEQGHGLGVEFYSEADPDMHFIEVECYGRAAEIGIYRNEPPALDSILAKVNSCCIPIILYNAEGDVGHYSPIVGIDGKWVLLPYTDEKFMLKEELQIRWSAPGIFRQCILIHGS